MKSRTLVLALAGSVMVLFAVTRISMSGSEQNQDEKATPIVVGVLTENQKLHSKLWGRYHTGRRLDAPPSRNYKGEIEQGVYIEPGTPVINPDAPSITFEEFISHLNCDADAVVTVIIKDKVSQLTDNREFVFTDYTAEVEEIYKNSRAAAIRQGGAITLTRPGGRVEIKGKAVSAVDSSFKPLKSGERYLLFLKLVPETGAYQTIRQGSFSVKQDTLIPMTEESVPGGRDSRILTSGVRTALHTNCNKQ